ncbi:MAG: aldehyde ferredoxin oxidoreductase family protein, partial [Anaerolineae bacterium]|nr:aldehyde ferredoxin oxidoreductase family protein [Anaerolineae bacterium]
RWLHVDLSTGSIRTLPLDERDALRFVGGSGLAARMLACEVAAGPDPFGPANPLVFTTGPLAGTPAPTSNRFTAAARSPLTLLWGEGDCGGRWASALKGAGFDAVLITGQASAPVYLHVEEGQAELRDARELWGLDTYELDLGAPTVCIGPAGERLVRYASIMHDGRAGRAVGRTGLGAVMGAKGLKAIVARGTQRPTVAHPGALRDSVRATIGDVIEALQAFRANGTAGSVQNYEKLGNLPIKNWRLGAWPEGAARITGSAMTETILTGRYACGNCPIGCGREVAIESGPHAGVRGGGPEYETAGALGSLCLIDDLEALAHMNEVCNRLGIDTISAGGVLAMAMEARERGLWADGPAWGDGEAAIRLLERIGRREGEVATLLGEGVRRIAEAWGGQAREFAIHIKGLELPMHDPRVYVSQAIGYATSTRGACHLQGFSHFFERLGRAPALGIPEPMPRETGEGKGRMVADLQNLMALFDSLKLCKFLLLGYFQPERLVEWANAVTGWELDLAQWLRTGERICNLRRAINARLGASRADDILPMRLLAHRRGDGGAPTNLAPFGQMLADYYAARRWSEFGLPTRELMCELDLEEYADWVAP